MNFEDNPVFANMPPLDRMRKIRRDIIKSINEYREKEGHLGLFMDILTNRAATEYAEYLLDHDEDENVKKEILNKHLLVGDVVVLVGISNLEEEEQEDKILYNEFMDAHGLLCELDDDREKLLKPNYTHIGVGFAWNKTSVKVVEFLSEKPLMIN